MIVYVLMFCFTCKTPALVPYTPTDCQVISVHKEIDNAFKRAWEHCKGDDPAHECLESMYVETMEVQE